MTTFRRILSIVLMTIGAAALISAGWIALNFTLPETKVSFKDADEIHNSVYGDNSLSKLLEQNLRMQEATFSAQKHGTQSILENIRELQVSSNRIFLSVFILLGFSIFCQVAAFMILPRTVKLHNHSLAQLESIMWESWVADGAKGKDDKFTVQKSAYPVHLCGCSSSGVPVHLCGCGNAAYPVHLCQLCGECS